MGVFSKWSILEKVEDRLEGQIIGNFNYPFVKDDLDPNLLVYSDRPMEFYVSCVVLVVSSIISTIWIIVTLFTPLSLGQGIIFPVALVIYFFYRATQTFKTRSYRVNVDAGFYQFHVGGEQVQKGKLHNLYFRLHERSTTGFPYYEIVLNGYKVSCVSLSGFSKNIRKMRELGKGMSKRLSINYFDCKDVSAHHIVHWERPPDLSSSSHSLLDETNYKIL
ncbi:uncharacterized protein LOC134823528 [Bolinopsis microptera]|uniref:uncharacterized protein LOC134823528 n=1 Tax=Bolinopsis microptera TaxID=2820187 RepID=UPI00307A03AF